MKTIMRRIYRLEDQFGPAKETEFSRQMGELVLAARQRVAEARERWGLEAVELPPLDLPPGCHSRIDILNAGRRRAAVGYQRSRE